MTESKSKKVRARLDALLLAKSGMELAEMDLSIRGAGEIFGTRQSGFGELKIANYQDIDLIKITRKFANEVILKPKKYKKILTYYREHQKAAN